MTFSYTSYKVTFRMCIAHVNDLVIQLHCVTLCITKSFITHVVPNVKALKCVFNDAFKI